MELETTPPVHDPELDGSRHRAEATAPWHDVHLPQEYQRLLANPFLAVTIFLIGLALIGIAFRERRLNLEAGCVYAFNRGQAEVDPQGRLGGARLSTALKACQRLLAWAEPPRRQFRPGPHDRPSGRVRRSIVCNTRVPSLRIR